MKKILTILTLVLMVWGCSKKATPAKSDPSLDTAETIAGREVFNSKCHKCHGLKNPANYTAAKWVPILNKMAPRAKLDSTQKSNVLAYVQAYAKKG